MKNIQGTEENLDIVIKDGQKVHKYHNGLKGYYRESTYDSNGKVLTYKNSNGISRGFDIPEYTMDKLVNKLGNFKIKK